MYLMLLLTPAPAANLLTVIEYFPVCAPTPGVKVATDVSTVDPPTPFTVNGVKFVEDKIFLSELLESKRNFANLLYP